jgi:hypothetical protein
MADPTTAATAANDTAAPAQGALPLGAPPAAAAPPPAKASVLVNPEAPAAVAPPPAAEAAKTTPEPAKPADAPGEQKTQTDATPEAAKEGDKPTTAPLALKFVEGVVADPKLIEMVQEAHDKFGLKPEGAQALTDRFVAYQQHLEQERIQTWEQTQKEWTESLKADKAFGGANYDKNRLLANKALARFDLGGELTAELTKTGFANWPPFVRMLAEIGRRNGEDTVAGTVAQEPKRTLTEEERLRARFPNSPGMNP